MATKLKMSGSWSIPIFYQLHTLFLFTRSDIKTVIIPQMLFALSSALTSGFKTVSTPTPPPISVIPSILKAILWLWTTLLVENIANQRLPFSILEDSRNKPWRPLPSSRLTASTSQNWLIHLIPLAIAVGATANAYRETATLFVLVWMYNDVDGANKSIWWRNALTAGGLGCFSAGVTAITSGPVEYSPSSGPFLWVVLTALAVFTTVHAQDFPDMVGDAARGRETVPLLYGEKTARISLAVGVLLWSFVCPAFWDLPVRWFAPTVGLGMLLVCLSAFRWDEESNEWIWKAWCLWIGTIYLLPLMNLVAVVHS
ncbi:uncharacterized protein BDR25DRAFT_323911 [Lindgomyces ingoldianus]|uniref:Uncharacterized protein n=1 Tax=Lindgomyces ingoldianus TaxID=673940 RepID=A0ACB6R4Y6_9PLEO|nr:uncharacterized protein BDR25DRAFT_323911 [Lindgomyces ingoldianus]KAF2473362.1 hypothetical protein BDR25DRAFT_323911 [Lindgomyces ingoldianus]